MMKLEQVYLGLGGNIGNTAAIFDQSLQMLEAIPEVHSVKCSSYYQTSPVSPIPQRDYLNAVVSFETSLNPFMLFDELQKIETNLGKVEKIKEAPRMIDLDLLLFGDAFIATSELSIPHPKFLERLFVLIPLCELTDSIVVPKNAHEHIRIDLPAYIKQFSNPHSETVGVLCRR